MSCQWLTCRTSEGFDDIDCNMACTYGACSMFVISCGFCATCCRTLRTASMPNSSVTIQARNTIRLKWWASVWRIIVYSINHSITQLIWCPGNHSFRFRTVTHFSCWTLWASDNSSQTRCGLHADFVSTQIYKEPRSGKRIGVQGAWANYRKTLRAVIMHTYH